MVNVTARADVAILIIDDDDVARLVLHHQLTTLGYQVVEAKNAAEGLEILSKRGVNLIISDYDMPGMSGVELLRDLGPDPETPFVLLTGFATIEEFGDDSDAVGRMAQFLTKPVSSSALADLLDRLIPDPVCDVDDR